MTRPAHRRRGSCAVTALLWLAVIALLLLIVGLAGLFTSNAATAFNDVKAKFTELSAKSTKFEAPAKVEIDLPEGGAIIAFAPDGTVGDKRIGMPPPQVSYSVTITDPEGKGVTVERNNSPRNPGSPFEIIGFFKTKSAGKYSVEVKPADGSDTPAAIMVAGGGEEDIQSIANSATSILQGFGSGCLAICGLIGLVGFGVPALVLRARAKKVQPDPMAQF